MNSNNLQPNPHSDRRSYSELEARVLDLQNEVQELRNDIKDLVDAWKTARGVTSFVKWVGSISVGAGVLLALFNQHGGRG